MDKNGIINLLKPQNETSHDMVYFLRRLTGIKKIGHSGTLDPMATGVLPMFIGNATRLIEYHDDYHKRYIAGFLLGIETDTYDIWGEIKKETPASQIKKTEIENVLKYFIGNIEQTPPIYSAIRVDGKRLYEYARKGQEVTIEKRSVHIKKIELIEYNEKNKQGIIDVTCQRGTYIRSICHDLGKMLNVGACMNSLERVESGEFKIENAFSPDKLKQNWEKALLPIDFGLNDYGKLKVPEKRVDWLLNGGYLRPDEVDIIKVPDNHLTKKCYRTYCGNDFLAMMSFNGKYYKPTKVLKRG